MGDNIISMKRMKAYIKTFGCQMNVHDSEKIGGILRSEGYDLTEERDEADVVIYNTCSIRQKAEQKFLSDLGRMKRAKQKRPGLKIVAAGCIAQQMGQDLIKRAPVVDFVVGPQNLYSISSLLKNGNGAVATDPNPDAALMELPAERKDDAGRAWVNIMYGCNNFCTYCIVPFTRGREVSRPTRSIVEEVRALAGSGYHEVTLLGQNVNSYKDETDFPGLLEQLNGIQGIKRIRFVTSHPKDLSERLVDAMAGLPSICESIHLPLQSGSDRVLKLMNRKYTFDQYFEKVQMLRERVPGVTITSDIIAGFPGETEEDHGRTIEAIRRVGYDGLFAFAYSPRPGTKASEMDGQLPDEIRLARLNELLKLQDSITLNNNDNYISRTVEVLIEGTSETDSSRLSCRTRGNKIVLIEGDPKVLRGTYQNVLIEKANLHSLSGRIIN